MKRSTNINQILALFIALFVVTAFSACSDISGTDYSNDISSESFEQEFDKKSEKEEITGSALDTNLDYGKQQGKIYVCKFVRTPNDKKGGGDWESPKKGNEGLVHVSPNSIRNELRNMEGGSIKFPEVNINDWWQDAHTRSKVISPAIGYNLLYANSEIDHDYFLGLLSSACDPEVDQECEGDLCEDDTDDSGKGDNKNTKD